MFNFLKKAKPVNFSTLQLDLHSHLIPGIDDGSKSVEESLHLLRSLQQMGFSTIITTPHVYAEFYPNTAQTIQQGAQVMQKAIREAALSIEFRTAAEYFMDEHFEQLLENEELLTLDGRKVLVEMSFFSEPPKLHSYIFQMRTKGYEPILAHPERYDYLNKSQYQRLRELGCSFQINVLSLLGHYGAPIQKNALLLLKNKWADFLGTDMHHEEHAELIQTALKKNRTLRKVLKAYSFQNKKLAEELQ